MAISIIGANDVGPVQAAIEVLILCIVSKHPQIRHKICHQDRS
ncbi:hypothetical protein Hanom_Chr07g00593241 [Helianthus anomalus]